MAKNKTRKNKKETDLGKEFKELTLEAWDLARKKIDKGVKGLVKQGKISAEKGRGLIEEQKKEWEEKRKEKLLKELKDLGFPTPQEYKKLKKEVEELKNKLK